MSDYKGDRTTGFASPAADAVEGPIDLAEVLDLRRPSRYPVRLRGATFRTRGIMDGDILIADTSGQQISGQLVIASVSGPQCIIGTQIYGSTSISRKWQPLGGCHPSDVGQQSWGVRNVRF